MAMHSWKRSYGSLTAALFLSLAASFASLPAISHAEDDGKKQVLVLHSYHRGFKWTDDITSGIESVFRENNLKTSIHYEYMDTKRFSGKAYYALLHDIYKYKYGNMKFDVIMSSDNDAFDYLIEHRNGLFPGTSVVFCGVNYFDSAMLKGKKLFTGVNEEADIKSTIDVALRNHPNARQIAVINDTTTTGLIMHNKLLELIPAYRKKVDFIFLEDMEMPEILDKVQKLPADSLVLFTIFSRDKAGRAYEYDESVALVVERCKVPIYSVWDFYLGNGIVGGMLTSGYYQGETAARMAARILRGDKVENIPIVMKSPNRYMFDHHQLERFRLDFFPLPEGSIVINKPAPFTVSKNIIRGIVAVLAGLSLTVLYLLRKLAKHKRPPQEEGNEDLNTKGPQV